jgi:acetylornithine deacetylase/succinyl-diaminopimelate desuccinylase-like protein
MATMYDDIRAAVGADFPRTQSELEAMVRIPSVSAPDFDPSEVRRSAEYVASLLRDSGAQNVQLLELEGAHPAVYGYKQGPEGSPTVLLYAHHDVQPPGPDSIWETDPFNPIERDGRLFGRGTADDKCGIATHLSTLRVLEDLPVTVKVFIEGEEEIGSLHLVDFLDAYAETLSSDAIVIADAGNWRVGTPALATSLRGLVDLTVTVRTLQNGVHSGSFGGIYPDAISALVRTLSRLHNDDGTIAVQGLVSEDADELDLTIEEINEQMLPVDGLEQIGTGTLTSRTWRQAAISVLAIDAVPISKAINQIVPEASAKVSMRIPPGQDPSAALAALKSHLEATVPWGAEISLSNGATASAFELDTSGPAYDAFRKGMATGYDHAPLEIGVGGSIPFVAAFSERYPDASILLVGASDPMSRYHGPNESLELADLKSAIVAQAIALMEMGS